MGALDDLLPIRILQVDGQDVAYAPRLAFGNGFSSSTSGDTVTVEVIPETVVDLIPDATNASAGLATAAQITMLEDHETRIDALEAATVTTRSGTVSLTAAQAWADVGLPIALAAETTATYEVTLDVSWPAHTISGEVAIDASKHVRDMVIAVTRDASNGVVVVTDAGDVVTGDAWAPAGVGTAAQNRVELRIVGDGAAGWQIEAQRATTAADATATAHVAATVRLLTSTDWEDDATPTVADPLRDDVAALEAIDAGTRLDAIEAGTGESTLTTLSANGALVYGTVRVTGGDTFTLPALSATSGKCKAVGALFELSADCTVTADGSDTIIDDTLAAVASVTVTAGTRALTFLDAGGSVWAVSAGLVAV